MLRSATLNPNERYLRKVQSAVRQAASKLTAVLMNPFANCAGSLSGPTTDALPVTPGDTVDLHHVAVGLYIETGGTIVIDTVKGETHTLMVADFSILPLGVRRVHATGTTATGIHALVLA